MKIKHSSNTVDQEQQKVVKVNNMTKKFLDKDFVTDWQQVSKKNENTETESLRNKNRENIS